MQTFEQTKNKKKINNPQNITIRYVSIPLRVIDIWLWHKICNENENVTHFQAQTKTQNGQQQQQQQK